MTTTATRYEIGQTYHLPPGTLLLERNIRDAKPDQELLDSVATYGVLEPVGAVLNGAGALVVRSGHRRTLAALQVKRDTVPVYVRGNDDLAPEAEAVRVIEQRHENTVRAGLTTAEDVASVAQLAAFGLTAEQIVEQAQISEDRVATATRVAGSKMATKAAVKWDNLSLEHVAAIAEFEDDEKAVKALVQSANDGRFDHTVQRMRDDRTAAENKAACIAEIIAAGVKPLDTPPSYMDKTKPLDRLRDKAGKKITAKGHADCPGHVAWPARQPLMKYSPEYGCLDYQKHGHKDSYASSSSSKPAAADMSEKEREAAAKARRLVIDNNKAWTSATTVRRRYVLEEISKLNSAPRGAAAFIASGISIDGDQLIHDYKHEPEDLSREWLGVKKGGAGRVHDLTPLVKGKPADRALVIALVHMLAIYECKAAGKDAWRRNGTNNATGRYLRFLETTGYVLSDVEKYAISQKTA